MNLRMTLLHAPAAALFLATPANASVVVGQTNDFEDGTTQGWQTNLLGMGGAHQPVVRSGGAGGPGDDYLVITSTGGAGSGSRLNIINATQWGGNYLASGVSGFSAQLNNLGATDLYLRILFEDPGPMSPPLNIAYSTDAFFLPAGGGWTDAFFSASPAALTSGIGDVSAALANTTTIRLYHSIADAFPSPVGGILPVTGTLGLDDFRATGAIPEPSTWAMMIGGFASMAAALRSRRRRKFALSSTNKMGAPPPVGHAKARAAAAGWKRAVQ